MRIPEIELREIKKWGDEEKLIATKNLLQDKTCENCRYKLYCSLEKNTYNTCYRYKKL